MRTTEEWSIRTANDWRTLFTRAALGLTLGALAGAATLLLVYASGPGFTVEMDRDVPRFLKGLYDVERAGNETFAWSGPSATMTLRGLDRGIGWSCRIRLRGGRQDVSTLPQVVATVDGLIVTTAQTSNEYQDVEVSLPAKPDTTTSVIQLTASNTFVPGPGDSRALGFLIDRWECAPMTGRFVTPPRSTLVAAIVGGALFGLLFALAGANLVALLAAVVIFGIAQAVPLTWEFAPFTDYAARAISLAGWTAAVVISLGVASTRASAAGLSAPARNVLVGTAAIFFLKLLALTHPSKLPVDIVFHAHRLEWVLDGRFFFTQPMPSGVRFPYAIGLYLFAAPWSLVSNDHVLILRAVVTAVEAAGAILVYLMISRLWRDPVAAVAGALLFNLVPLTFQILHNANMTNAFGQYVAFAALAAAILLPLGPGRHGSFAALTLLTAWALLSHVSTFTTLLVILIVLALLYRFASAPDERAASTRVLLAVCVAAVLSVVSYYAWFGDAYRSALRVRATAGAAAAAPSTAPAATQGETLGQRILEAADLTLVATGWPLLLLGIVGAVAAWRTGWRDRLSLGVIALLAVYGTFVLAVVFMPVEQSFRRYAAEFISRVTLATYPAVVILAARGVSWLWTAGTIGKLLAGFATIAAMNVGVSSWIGWLR